MNRTRCDIFIGNDATCYLLTHHLCIASADTTISHIYLGDIPPHRRDDVNNERDNNLLTLNSSGDALLSLRCRQCRPRATNNTVAISCREPLRDSSIDAAGQRRVFGVVTRRVRVSRIADITRRAMLTMRPTASTYEHHNAQRERRDILC